MKISTCSKGEGMVGATSNLNCLLPRHAFDELRCRDVGLCGVDAELPVEVVTPRIDLRV